MSRRGFLRCTAVAAAVGLLAAACGPQDGEETPMDAEQILSEAGFTAPELDLQVTDRPLGGAEEWSHVVTFTGPAETIGSWVSESFPGGIESRAYKDDMQVAVDQLGEGVQKKGDLLASGTHGSVAFVVVVGQGDEPTVHVAVRRTDR